MSTLQHRTPHAVKHRKTESPEKLRGGYYTDHVVARFLAQWATEGGAKRILEPSCGDGAFFRALKDLSWGGRLTSVFACELEPSEAARAQSEVSAIQPGTSEMHVGDFLSWFLDAGEHIAPFDAIIGNPPFVRYQYLDHRMQGLSERIFKRCNLRFTRHTNLWVPFVIASIEMLRPGGRLAFVVPSEILHVLHSESVRELLLQTCSRLLVLDPEELLFDKTIQGVVLLMAEKQINTSSGRGAIAVQRISGCGALQKPASDYFASANFISACEVGSKWTRAFLSSDERILLDNAQASTKVTSFGHIASATVGIVTGANSYFLVPDSIVEKFELEPYVHPMFGRSEHVPGIIYGAKQHAQNRKDGMPTNFVLFPADRKSLTAGARRYIRIGESSGLHTRYKCKVRAPWYVVPNLPASPIAMPKRAHNFPRLIMNTMKARNTDTAYRVTPHRGVADQKLVFCFINSLTALSCEIEGRHYGGGVLELVPTEISRILIPHPSFIGSVPKLGIAQLDHMIRSGSPAHEILEKNDRLVLGDLGFSRDECDHLRSAWSRLRDRRCRSGSTGSQDL